MSLKYFLIIISSLIIWALGLVFGTYRGEEIIWYAGGDIGFNSYVMRFPKQQLTIVCFSNIALCGNAEKMAKQVADVLAVQKLSKLSDAP